jgi:hypothetical protein
MNTITKSKILSILVIILLIANMTSMAIFWLKKDQRPPRNGGGNTADFLIKELKLDSAQQKLYQQLREEHRDQLEKLKEETRNSKDAFFNLLNKDAVSESDLQTAAANAATKQQQIDIITFNHFKKVRGICNDEQKKKFDEIIQEALRMQGPGAPDQHQGPPPMNGHNGPPGPPPNDRMGDGPPNDRPPPPQP